MVQVLVSSVALSMVHAAIPNHWMPLVAVGNTEKWSVRETLVATGIAGVAHVLSTVLIGIAIGWAGFALYSEYEWLIYSVAPAILIVLGIIYLVLHWRSGDLHNHHFEEVLGKENVSRASLIGSLTLAMFFSPCLELESYYFTAGMYGWTAILAVSLVYLVVTVAGMILLVYLGLKGVQKFDLHFLEHYEKAITGWVLVLIGIGTLLFNI